MTKSPRKNVPDVGIEPGAACMPNELASDRATAPGQGFRWRHIPGRIVRKQYIYTFPSLKRFLRQLYPIVVSRPD